MGRVTRDWHWGHQGQGGHRCPSALNASEIELFSHNARDWVRFRISPDPRCAAEVGCAAPVADVRVVKDSGGHAEERFVITTPLRIGDGPESWPIEISLANRRGMRFAMLLGRTAVRRRFAVDPARSFVAGVPPPERASARRFVL